MHLPPGTPRSRVAQRLAGLLAGIFVALVTAPLLGGCKRESMPKPPPSLVTSVENVERAMERDSAGEVGVACEELARELFDFKNSPGMPALSAADLHRLGMEIAALGAQHEPGRPVQTSAWRDARARLDRVLGGKSPEEGPRYQIDMPAEVEAAIAAVDAALRAGDVDASLRAMDAARGPLLQWAAKLPPGGRAHRLVEIAEGDLIRIGITPPGGATIDDLRKGWARMKQRMRPGAE